MKIPLTARSVSIIYPLLGRYSRIEGMLDRSHFGHQISCSYEIGMRITTGEDEVKSCRLVFDEAENILNLHQTKVNSVRDLIKDQNIQ